MSVRYEPSSEPLHISVAGWFWLALNARLVWLKPKPYTLNPKP